MARPDYERDWDWVNFPATDTLVDSESENNAIDKMLENVPHRDDFFWVSIEGNHGTCIKDIFGAVMAACDRRGWSIDFYEPSEEKMGTFTATNIEDVRKNFDTWVWALRIILMRCQGRRTCFVSARSPYTQLNVVCVELEARGQVTRDEVDAFRRHVRREMAALPQPDVFVYVESTPQDCCARLDSVARPGTPVQSLESLETWNRAYRRWMDPLHPIRIQDVYGLHHMRAALKQLPRASDT